MSLGQALATAMSGLRVTQASLALVSSNVANAESPGYVRKTLNQITGVTGDYGSSVRINGVNRELDQYLQTQIRTESSGAAFPMSARPISPICSRSMATRIPPAPSRMRSTS